MSLLNIIYLLLGGKMTINKLYQNTLNKFDEICKIPHCSGNEEQIGKWLINWAKSQNFVAKQDEVGNVIIEVPAKGNISSNQTVVLQGHMDMVCVKNEAYEHDFAKDPIQNYIEDGWMKAKGTTLGADNGIALAIAMAIAEDQNIVHPPLELLFTVDEERGLTGANFLKANTLKGKILLNIDSETEGEFTIGCAGGKDTHIELGLTYEQLKNAKMIDIKIAGFTGGHSGIEIHQNRVNVIQVFARILNHIGLQNEYRLVDIKAGIAHNAIPRDGVLKIAVNEAEASDILHKLDNFFDLFLEEYINCDEDDATFEMNIQDLENNTVVSKEDSQKVVNMLMALPHGVAYMSAANPELVETSNNLAIVYIEDQKLKVLTSQRSSSASRNEFITQKIESIARLAGAKVESGNGYPSWQPNWESELLRKCKEQYFELYKKEAKVNVIHAGLECGIIGAKHDGMDMISIGPNIRTPHSPEEKMEIISVEKVLAFLVMLLKSL
jgi:dipeptidase D